MKTEKAKGRKMSDFQKYKILSNVKYVLSIIAGIAVFFGVYNGIVYETSTDNLISDFDATSSLEKMETPFGIYEGEVSHGVMEGNGNMFFYTGEVYEGQWDNDQMSGTGELQYTEGTYKGDYSDGARSGHGTFTWNDSAEYSGEWSNDKMEGKGKLTAADGTLYDGTFAENSFKDGSIVVKKEKATYTYKVTDGKVTNSIKIAFENGDTYAGAFNTAKNCIDGDGNMVFKDGGSYNGDFKDGKREGTGTFKWENGDVYTGGWKNDLMDGEGTFTYKNGDVLDGSFKEGYPDGDLEFTDSEDTWDTSWKNGKCVKVEEQ